MSMGYAKKDIEESLKQNRYDEIMATYLLLGRKSFEVCTIILCYYSCCLLIVNCSLSLSPEYNSLVVIVVATETIH